MKFIPILFSTEMVQAEQAGRKTQTRRTKGLETINANPNNYRLLTSFDRPEDSSTAFYISPKGGLYVQFMRGYKNIDVKCPFGQVGDVFWVREKFAYIEGFNELEQYIKYLYAADGEDTFLKYSPSIHMPKEAARIFLKITDIRVERLNDISESDAVSEGISVLKSKEETFYKCYPAKDFRDGSFVTKASSSFSTLWAMINGWDSWSKNPWVWVIEFERIERPEGFL